MFVVYLSAPPLVDNNVLKFKNHYYNNGNNLLNTTVLYINNLWLLEQFLLQHLFCHFYKGGNCGPQATCKTWKSVSTINVPSIMMFFSITLYLLPPTYWYLAPSKTLSHYKGAITLSKISCLTFSLPPEPEGDWNN